MLDEAMAGVIGGEGGDPLAVAQMSCMTMVVCGSCFDLERATQWVQALERFINQYGCPFLYAECRTYYGRVLFENGDWSAAEVLLAEAIAMSRGVFPAPHAFAAGTLAELRLAQGRIEDADRALRGVEGREEAAAAVASLHMAQGEPSAAAAVLRRRMAATSPRQLDVAVVIELLGEAEIALADLAGAIGRGRALVALGTAQFSGADWTVRDVEPVAGLRAAYEVELAARLVGRDYIRYAREAGHSWHDIVAAMNLTPGRVGEMGAESIADAAFTYATGSADTEFARRYGRIFADASPPLERTSLIPVMSMSSAG